jgi:hypothetical protein
MIREMSPENLTLAPVNDTATGLPTTFAPNNFSSSDASSFGLSTTIATSFNETVPVHLDLLELSVLGIKGLIFGSIILGAVLGNALVIISVHRNRKLR